MNFDISLLKPEELAVFALRKLYSEAGYKPFKMSKFEEYDLYSKNKDFLVSEGIITFTDTDGKLLALKPDVTLSIIKNAKDAGGLDKYFYDENVYRISKDAASYREIRQTGLECIGESGTKQQKEVLTLAKESLALIGKDYMLCLSSVDLVKLLLSASSLQEESYPTFYEALEQKNQDLLLSLCQEQDFALLSPLFASNATLSSLKGLLDTEEYKKEWQRLSDILTDLSAPEVKLDFSVTPQNSYYNGLVFKGFLRGIASAVLSGGQYDKLMKKMGKRGGAIGFAVYLDALGQRTAAGEQSEDCYINVALPKGRLGEKVYDMFEKAGFSCPSIRENTRKLIYENSELKLRFFWVKPSDVSIYVERGAADIGVAGKDILAEYNPDVFELLDLNVGKCRMAVAGKKDFTDDESKTLRVATKFSHIAKAFYKKKCRDIDIIHLNGSIELAPILGLSDVIVDIVETGKTLLENGLEPYESIFPISARLVANKASYHFKADKIEKIKQGLFPYVPKD